MRTNSPSRIVLRLCICMLMVPVLSNTGISQEAGVDGAVHPYSVNYYVTGSILAVGLAAEKLALTGITSKSPLSMTELSLLSRTDLTPIDRWALDQDLSTMGHYVQLSDDVLTGIVVLPLLTMIDGRIRGDWLDVILLYAETILLTNNLYLLSPVGPTFQNRVRPVGYYEALGDAEVRTRGSNRNSLYSGHVASAASASFFTAKVFCDYHPELGWEKYMIYGAAAVPPLILSYLRLRALAHFPSDIAVGFGVGMLCGILIPEFHRIDTKSTTIRVYSSSSGSGLRVTWQPY